MMFFMQSALMTFEVERMLLAWKIGFVKVMLALWLNVHLPVLLHRGFMFSLQMGVNMTDGGLNLRFLKSPRVAA